MWSVLKAIENCPIKHTFQLLTKNPERIPLDYEFPDNVWVGTTVTNELIGSWKLDTTPIKGEIFVDDVPWGSAPQEIRFSDWKNIEAIKKVNAKVRFVSFEPLLGMLPDKICLNGLQWIIIGKLTGSRRVKLQPGWVEGIMTEADSHNIPVFIKNNLYWLVERQDFPSMKIARKIDEGDIVYVKPSMGNGRYILDEQGKPKKFYVKVILSWKYCITSPLELKEYSYQDLKTLISELELAT